MLENARKRIVNKTDNVIMLLYKSTAYLHFEYCMQFYFTPRQKRYSRNRNVKKKAVWMIKVMEQLLYKEQLNYVGLSILKTDDSNTCLRSINMSDREKLNRETLFIVSLNTDCRVIK